MDVCVGIYENMWKLRLRMYMSINYVKPWQGGSHIWQPDWYTVMKLYLVGLGRQAELLWTIETIRQS